MSARRLALFIADATDLVGVEDLGHGKRVGLIARAVAAHAGLAASEVDAILEAGLVHDLGVSSTRVHRTLISELDWDGAAEHCFRGHRLLAGFEPLAHAATSVLHHHTHWEDIGRAGLPERAALAANAVYLADRVDMLRSTLPPGEAAFHAEDVRGRIASRTGDFFAPRLVQGFLEASANDAFWLELEPDGVAGTMAELEAASDPAPLPLETLRSLAILLAGVVDAKSPYTASHSLGVSRLSHLLGSLAGLDDLSIRRLEIAGLLHDVGKLQLPDEILDKPAHLDPAEASRMRSHAWVTLRVLRRIAGIGPIAEWAAYHHETLDGAGYPFRLDARDLPVQARIVKVADVFQALAQARPYRGPVAPAGCLAVLQEMARAGQVDPHLVGLVASHLARCHAAAVDVRPAA